MKLSKIPLWLLLFLPGILLFLAWPPLSIFIFLFVAFIPVYELDRRIDLKQKKRYFFSVYMAMFLWNLFTTWWVWNSSSWGALVMLIFNALFMTLPWVLMRFSRRWVSVSQSQLLLIIFWLLFEFLHQRWDLSWPWLTLGNAFSGVPWYVQWYEITGTTGGSFLVLFVNLLLFKAWTNKKPKLAIYGGGLVVLALLVSLLFRFVVSNTENQKINVVLLQPSFDPWNEKFTRDPGDMIREMIDISATAVDSNTQLLVWPETSLVDNIELGQIQQDYQVRQVTDFQKKFPKMSVLTGADMQQIYRHATKRPSHTARPTSEPDLWWDAYNSALFIDKTQSTAYYHKSKLVPGTEQMPLTNWFPAINAWAVKLDENSMTGSLGKTDSVVLFGKEKIIPAICYESIYGDFLRKFALAGGGIVAVITNDAWWGKTPGYKQHMALSQLRAIEQRKWVVRSANTGTTGFIDPYGTVHNATEWYEKKAIKMTVDLRYNKTIYTRMGDLPVLSFITIIIIISLLLIRNEE